MRLAADETTAPVLDPGRGRTKTGQLWAYARDDRPWGGTAPPAVAYVYASDRKSDRPVQHLKGFTGVLQVDGYAGYGALAAAGTVRLAFCWAIGGDDSMRSRSPGNAPIASEALARIAAIYAIAAEIRGREAEARHAARQQQTKPLVEGLKTWRKAQLAAVSRKSTIAEAIRYGLGRWDGLFASSMVAASRPTPMSLSAPSGRLPSIKNALFAGSDGGGEHWAILASLIETSKLNGIEPQAYLADTLARIANGHPINRLDELMPWTWIAYR